VSRGTWVFTFPDGTVLKFPKTTKKAAYVAALEGMGVRRLPNGTTCELHADLPAAREAFEQVFRQRYPEGSTFSIREAAETYHTARSIELIHRGDLLGAREALAIETVFRVVNDVTGKIAGTKQSRIEAEHLASAMREALSDAESEISPVLGSRDYASEMITCREEGVSSSRRTSVSNMNAARDAIPVATHLG
jgi:hypothetical protein